MSYPDRHDLVLQGEAATARLAGDIARDVRPGDVIALSGDLGAGKTSFARAFLRALSSDPALEVPSPTFTLVQDYATPRGRVVHADLYRLRGPDELIELGLAEGLEDAVLLVEWPERAGAMFDTAHRLDLVFALSPAEADDVRRLALIPGAGWRERIGLIVAARKLIDGAGWSEAQRLHMQGDASTRAYERLTRPDGRSAVLMISPPRPDGPPVRDGRPYSALAKLAERVDAFVAMDKGLRALGLSAPEIHAQDLKTGLLLIEDLGGEGVLVDGAPDPGRYTAAAELLARLHVQELPTILPVAEGRDHVIPDFDREALLIEVDLLLDWYVPHIAKASPAPSSRNAFGRIWTDLAVRLAEITGPRDRTWVLRDFHSPNLIWLPEREGDARLGLIDFQDALLGHPAYDVASLAQDARVDVAPELELALISRYGAVRKAAQAEFDLAAFAEAYAILGAQRATKILGIFARLDRRDGKPAYLKHLPRIEGYLRRNLAHPALEALKAWYESETPGLVRA